MGFRAVAFSLLAVPFHNLALLSGVQGYGTYALITSGPLDGGKWACPSLGKPGTRLGFR